MIRLRTQPRSSFAEAARRFTFSGGPICFVPSWIYHWSSHIYILKVYPTLVLTTSISYLLFCQIPLLRLQQMFFNFGTLLSVILIGYRFLLDDFSREGSFLGLGPLTFARYVCIGLLMRISASGERFTIFTIIDIFKIIPSLIALTIADSRGPFYSCF